MTETVHFDKIENIGIIKVNNPPVNALSFSVRSGLVNVLNKIILDSTIEAVVLIGEGRTFVAGADITEFGKPMQNPDLNSVIAHFENSDLPIIAALHGTPLGGGLELAMGCNYRVALPSTMLGLPEVKLGIIPGAGGTQRLPRLIGPENALKIITSGNPINANLALDYGLIDMIINGNLLQEAISFAKKIASKKEHPSAKDMDAKINNFDKNIFNVYEKIIAKKMRGRKSPIHAIHAIKYSTELSFEEGLQKERELFKICHDSNESSAMIHAFFSERGAFKIPDVPKDTSLRKLDSAAVIGCGTMGVGIAMNFANAGIPVIVIENDSTVLEKGMSAIKSNYQSTLKKGRLKKDDVDKRLGIISSSTSMADVSKADIIIEAIFEEMDLKKELFAKLDKHAKQGAILASNTSTLDIDIIANSTNRPNDVIGTHFFSPANVMKLLEVVRGSKTDKEVIATTMKLGKTINKVPVLSGNCDGFIGNRMFHEYIRQAHALAEEGASVIDIDRVIYDFGWAMGPFAVNDLAGNDVGWRIRKRHKKEGKYDNLRYTSTVADKLCEMGRYGQKTYRGFYKYNKDDRGRLIDPEVDIMFEKISKEKGITRRPISDEEILNRLSWALVNTGSMILEEGFALRASDIDIVYIHGYGYPNWRGGPMKYAEDVGLVNVVKDISKFRERGDGMWQKCNLLEELARDGKNFSDFKYKV